MATPQIPPRPLRSQLAAQLAAQSGKSPNGLDGAPMIPPRPAGFRGDRSPSPNRDAYAPSPLNEPPTPGAEEKPASSFYGLHSAEASASQLSLPERSPSVSLPTIGQEGSEYADIADVMELSGGTPLERTTSSTPAQTRNVGSDLPLHAPKPALSQADAKARISTVTRTDSSQAAAAVGRRPSVPTATDDRDPHARGLKSRPSVASSLRSPSVASTERPDSAIGEAEQGIPEIGQQVPMYPEAGDVQAPSPSPYAAQHPTGIGFYNDGSRARSHGRRRSERDAFAIPPGSYGLHGHGTVANTGQFEKAWYDKHPEALAKEEGLYSPALRDARSDYVMSSEDLNKLVRETAARGAGFGTSGDIPSMPDEQIGYIASEEYASRMASPRPGSAAQSRPHTATHPPVESPLRKTAFPAHLFESPGAERGHGGARPSSTTSENDDEIIHIDEPEHHVSKYSGNGYDPPTVDLGPEGGNTRSEGGMVDEHGNGVPILASDEISEDQAHLQPAIPPAHYPADDDHQLYRSTSRSQSVASSRATSRPASRTGSIAAGSSGLSRFTTHEDVDHHTPLEDVEEYEPLFAEDDDEETKMQKVKDHAQRFRQRADARSRFPSQDIWEDAPDSVNLETEVKTPEPVQTAPPPISSTTSDPSKTGKGVQPASSTTFETEEQEAARKHEFTENDRARLLSREERIAKSSFQPHIRHEMHRPDMQHRFPSQDIWEDTPDYAHLEATIEPADGNDPTAKGRQASGSTTLDKNDLATVAGAVVITARDGPSREGATAGAAAMPLRQGSVGEGAAIPSIPPRPSKATSNEAAANASNQPQIPPRPAGKDQRVQSPLSGLSQVLSADSQMADDEREASSASDMRDASLASGERAPFGTDDSSRRPPSIPGRPKPQIPARPIKQFSGDNIDTDILSTSGGSNDSGMRALSTSGGSNDSSSTALRVAPPPAPKPKPAIPARPVGGKIAALQAGFMSDLNQRLKLGPQGPSPAKERGSEDGDSGSAEDAAPLSDARKGRARGPARRKPAAAGSTSVSADGKSAAGETAGALASLSFSTPVVVWTVGDDGRLVVPEGKSVPDRHSDQAQGLDSKGQSTQTQNATLSSQSSHGLGSVLHESSSKAQGPAIEEDTHAAAAETMASSGRPESSVTSAIDNSIVHEDKPVTPAGTAETEQDPHALAGQGVEAP